MSAEIQLEEHDAVLTITFNRPEKRNALTAEMYEAFTRALQRASATTSIRAVRLGGAGGIFTSGNDLADFLHRPPLAEDSQVAQFLAALAGFEKPLVAAVSGHAIGVGATMLLHCDFVYADETALFQFSFVNIGLVPEAGSSMLLPGYVGRRAAVELLMLGEAIDARKAERMGLVTRTVAPAELDDLVRAQLAKLIALPAGALRSTKQLLRRAPESVQDRMAAEGRAFAERLTSAEVKEALTAFAEKRKPNFRSA